MLKRILLEHVNVNGADYIGTAGDFDLFRIRTWAAAQEFVSSADTTPAGEKWCQNEDTFNGHINEQTKLYFFVNIDTAAVVLGALSSNSSHTYSDPDGQRYALNYQLEDVGGGGNIPLGISEEVLALLPDANLHAVENNAPAEEENDEESEDNEIENDTTTGDLEWHFYDADGDELFTDTTDFDSRSREDAITIASQDEHIYRVEEVSLTTGEIVIIWERHDANPSDSVEETPAENNIKEPDNNFLKIRIVGDHAEVIGCRIRLPENLQSIEIPETYQEKPVTKIAPYAFYGISIDSIKAYHIKEIAPRAIVECSRKNRSDRATTILLNRRQRTKYYNSSVIFAGTNCAENAISFY